MTKTSALEALSPDPATTVEPTAAIGAGGPKPLSGGALSLACAWTAPVQPPGGCSKTETFPSGGSVSLATLANTSSPDIAIDGPNPIFTPPPEIDNVAEGRTAPDQPAAGRVNAYSVCTAT